ncbi:hypothetical protein KAU15_05950, partial [candidate division WOR-3 bacterium]|nr:hypothetical protein [candidate division WOR-3 bacterium]
MKISLKWINDFVDISNLDPYLIAEKLTIRTAETEGILAIKDNYSDIMSAHIKEIEKINDKYFKCTVIADKEYTVISGAPNTKKNMNTFFVKPGGMVDGNTIGERKMAETVSQGMLLSGKELGINNDHSGLYKLDNSIKPCTDIGDICDFYDHIIEIDNKSLTHRPDLWGIYGFSREIAAIFNLPLKEYTVFDESLIKSNTVIDIKILKKELCYRYIGLRINNIKISMSPINIQTRLMRTEHVPRNIIVDLT